MQTHEQMIQAAGIAAMIPGFQMAIDALQQSLDRMRAQLQQLQKGDAPPVKARRNPSKAYWSSMTPEERSKEMRRRIKKRRAAEAAKEAAA
jgi:hypothetical protein